MGKRNWQFIGRGGSFVIVDGIHSLQKAVLSKHMKEMKELAKTSRRRAFLAEKTARTKS